MAIVLRARVADAPSPMAIALGRRADLDVAVADRDAVVAGRAGARAGPKLVPTAIAAVAPTTCWHAEGDRAVAGRCSAGAAALPPPSASRERRRWRVFAPRAVAASVPVALALKPIAVTPAFEPDAVAPLPTAVAMARRVRPRRRCRQQPRQARSRSSCRRIAEMPPAADEAALQRPQSQAPAHCWSPHRCRARYNRSLAAAVVAPPPMAMLLAPAAVVSGLTVPPASIEMAPSPEATEPLPTAVEPIPVAFAGAAVPPPSAVEKLPVAVAPRPTASTVPVADASPLRWWQISGCTLPELQSPTAGLAKRGGSPQSTLTSGCTPLASVDVRWILQDWVFEADTTNALRCRRTS